MHSTRPVGAQHPTIILRERQRQRFAARSGDLFQFHRALAFEAGMVATEDQRGRGVEQAARGGGFEYIGVPLPGLVGQIQVGFRQQCLVRQ